MPPVSEAQRRWAFANEDKRGPEGRAARDYAQADPGGRLPAYSPKSRDEHMAKRAKVQSQRRTAGEFGVSQSTVSRGYRRLGKAK